MLDLGEIEPFDNVPPPIVRPPRHRSGGRAVLATLAVAGAVAAFASLGGTGGDEPAPSPTTTPTTRPDVVVHSRRGLDETVLIGAPVGYEATGSLATLDVARGSVVRRQHDVRLWPGDFQVPMLTVGGHLVWSDLERAWSIPIDLGEDPVVIGSASYVAPARDRDHVWLVQQNPGRVTEVGPRGAVRRPTFRLPSNTRPIAGVDDGLLVDSNEGAMLVDDRTGEILRTYWHRDVLTAAGHVALTTAGSLLDLTTGASAGIERRGTAGDLTPTSASFSPDGRFIALLTGDPDTLRAGVAIVDVAGALVAFHRIAGMGDVVWGSLVWSSASDALYFLASDGAESANRVIGIPVDGGAQTVAVLAGKGWYWIAVR